MSELSKKLKRRGSKDLSKKLASNKCTPEETKEITAILEGRGVLKHVAKKAKAKKAIAKKKSAPAKSSTDIICEFLKVGDTAKIKAKSRDKNLGKMIEAEVVKIYDCSRTGKEYVRLKADGHTYHKRLNHFEPAE